MASGLTVYVEQPPEKWPGFVYADVQTKNVYVIPVKYPIDCCILTMVAVLNVYARLSHFENSRDYSSSTQINSGIIVYTLIYSLKVVSQYHIVVCRN